MFSLCIDTKISKVTRQVSKLKALSVSLFVRLENDIFKKNMFRRVKLGKPTVQVRMSIKVKHGCVQVKHSEVL